MPLPTKSSRGPTSAFQVGAGRLNSGPHGCPVSDSAAGVLTPASQARLIQTPDLVFFLLYALGLGCVQEMDAD